MKFNNVSPNCGTAEGSVRASRSGRRFVAPALMLFSLGLSVLLTGCSGNFDPQLSGPEPNLASGKITGMIHGGQAPIYNAAIYIFDTGHAGYPGASVAANVSTITGSGNTFSGQVNGQYYGNYVTTNAQGLFTINGFTCTPGDGVYLVSVGGQPIYGTPNSSATEMAAMGICPSGGASALATSVPFVNINEVSTAAMAYALGGFTAAGYDFSHISTSATNSVGMANAFTNAAILYSVAANNGANSTSPIDPTHILLPQASTLNMMANILAGCVNSGGTTSNSSPCYILFQNATSNGTTGSGTVPNDTASAMINIVHNVKSNISNLYALASNSYAPYTPALSSTPNDFSIAIRYIAPLLTDAIHVAIDSTGSAYVVNADSLSPVTETPSVTKYIPGTGFVGTTSFSSTLNLLGIAIDQSNNILLVNDSTSAPVVMEYASSNTAALGTQSASPPTFSAATALGGSHQAPVLVVGPTNNVELNDVNAIYNAPYSGGTYGAATKISGSNASGVSGIAINGNGTTAFINSSSTTIWTVSSTGTFTSFNTGLGYNQYPAYDGMGREWITGYNSYQSNGDTLYLYNSTNTGTIAGFTGSGYYGTSDYEYPTIDGLGTVWTLNGPYTAGSCAVQATSQSSLSASTTNYGTGLFVDGNGTGSCVANSQYPAGSAIDQSGNVWVNVRQNNTDTVSGYLSEMLGIAAPTIQPLSVQTLKLLPSNTSLDIRP